jgi:60 kDa SS-A/Ro ribonucleoprotein
MSKLNPIKKPETKFSEERLAGGLGLKSAKQDPVSLLRRSVMACLLWEDNAYEDGQSSVENIKSLIPQVTPLDVATIAIEAREKQKLRHIPLFIAIEMLKYDSHKHLVSYVLSKVITRADQITDVLALYWKEGKRPLASQLKMGLAYAFNRFDEYQFAKYNRNTGIKFIDVMNLVRPKPNEEHVEIFRKIATDTLSTPDTWEVALSAGNDKKETWERLIVEKKLGALAFLRNLRNMVQSKVDHNIIKKGFTELKPSMLLPLNFLSAVDYCPEFIPEIDQLMVRCYSGLPKLPGYTIFIMDVSGSMNHILSSKSNFSRLHAGGAMCMLAVSQCEKIDLYCTAGSHVCHYTEKINYPRTGIILMDQIIGKANNLGGGGIFTRQCLEFIKEDINEIPDRIIVFSDSQDCDRTDRIPKPFAKHNYIVDVSAHSRGINYKGAWTAEISGWSEHFISYIASMEGLDNNFEN